MKHRPLSVLLPVPLLILALALTACAPKTQPGPVLDLLTLPQDLGAYLDPDTAHEPLFDNAQRRAMAERYLAKHFSPWDNAVPSYAKKDLFWGFARYESSTTWGENLQPRGPWWVHGLASLADPGDYPNRLRPAIATTHTDMRVLPTDEPIFADPTQPGEGFPFDYNQNSLVWAGTPLFVVQASADGAWLLCETRFAGGWIRAEDVAYVDDAFMREYRTGPHAAIIGERRPVIDQGGVFRFQARLGMLLPLRGEGEVLVPVRGLSGEARLVRAALEDGTGVLFPLVVTRANIAALGNRMMGRPYGWGGLYRQRDCSATLMDLFAPFGMALPRNSKAQARAGEVVEVSALSPQEKKAKLLTMAPLTTLVGKRGHIMLYAGSFRGQPLIYHTMWGIRTTAKGPLPGRKIVGATVVTTLEPGRELRTLAPGSLLVNTISTFTSLETPAP